MASGLDLRKYEDWVLLIASFLAALSQSLGAEPRFAIYAIILGAFAKALFSIVS